MREYFRDAIRLLFLLVEGSEPLSPAHGNGATRIFRGEAKLHALDFWVRYPDYLAAELLDRFEQTNSPEDLSIAQQIMSSDEPDVRRLPMIRYFFGAYDPIDTAISILSSRHLVVLTGRKSAGKIQETDFLIMPKAVEVTEEVEHKAPVLRWYRDRSQIVVGLAGDRKGSALKEQQYRRTPYAGTDRGTEIPSIKEEVAARLATITGRKK